MYQFAEEIPSLINCYFKLQVQLCKEKSRAPPPLVPLSAALSFDHSAISINQANQDHLQGACIETLPELPCEVEIKEMNMDPIFNAETAIYEPLNKKHKLSEMFGMNIQTKAEPIFEPDMEGARVSKEYQIKKEEKRTSILEQVLTGSLTINNHQNVPSRTKLTSKWWCAPCNNYYK